MWKRFARSVRSNIFFGLVLVTPLAVTLWIVNFLFTYITNYLVPRPWLQKELAPLYRILSLFLVIFGLYLVGLLIRNFIGRRLYRLGDTILARIPVIKTIYVAIRQISESFVNSRRTLFQQVVAVEFPRRGVYSLGFITAPAAVDVVARLPAGTGEWQDAVCVMVLTSPNPTSGFFMVVPRADLVLLDISVADAMKMLMSGGTVFPGRQGVVGQTLLERLEEWLHTDADTGAQ